MTLSIKYVAFYEECHYKKTNLVTLHVLFNCTSNILMWPKEDFVTMCSVVEGNPKRTELSHLPWETFLSKRKWNTTIRLALSFIYDMNEINKVYHLVFCFISHFQIKSHLYNAVYIFHFMIFTLCQKRDLSFFDKIGLNNCVKMCLRL